MAEEKTLAGNLPSRVRAIDLQDKLQALKARTPHPWLVVRGDAGFFAVHESEWKPWMGRAIYHFRFETEACAMAVMRTKGMTFYETLSRESSERRNGQ